ncbi:AAA family ATPase [Intestinimonas butyriciproducens]|uniref:AAA family ATPase n=1 Tax=Intestinimonas butyriciproducens TaxID=1297617 RepID=UPI00189FB7A2|nr:AAA family ATPase [Intestinimonas butyriciproducens]
MMLRVLHTADWHIGNFPGPDVNGENVRLKDIETCLSAMVGEAGMESPDLAIISGDVFHQARVWSDRGLREARIAIHYISALSRTGCHVCVLRGTPNHDNEEQFNMLRAYFDGYEDVTIMDRPGVYMVKAGEHTVDVAAIPGFDRGIYRAKHPGLSKEEEAQVFTEEIATLITGLKAQCTEGHVHILSTHFTVTGANTESGQTQLFAQYEPVIEPATLAAADFDLVCLGHIHRPQQLDGCRNTFYSGAVSGLNFNDEGQKRGFYIHDLFSKTRDGGPLDNIDSRFIPLPAREFRTISMTDTDITGIITGELDAVAENLWGWNDGVRGMIVRVLYDCTDEHNKALNKSLLEKAIYDAGAFWVSEISPQKISVTASKTDLGGDATPEDNLAAYLAERGKTPEEVGEHITLARPIIQEAIAGGSDERKTGVFTPLEIRVHNYRNYRDEAFSFEDIRFCTINGRNGAGKSTLFMDALLDALFEEPREGDLTGWICNAQDARSGSIELTFALGGRRYRVTRTRTKSGKATLNFAEFADGDWQNRSAEKIKDTQAIIEQTIGMDSLTLKACGLIMQDQYGLFLQADKEARVKILGNILGLGIYDAMYQAAAAASTEANRKVRELTAAAAGLAAGLPDAEALRENREQLSRQADMAKASLEADTQKRDNLKLRVQNAADAAERARKASARLEALMQKTAALEGQKKAQESAAADCDALLRQEPEVMDGVRRYAELLEEEKALLAEEATYKAKAGEVERLRGETARAERSVYDLTGALQTAEDAHVRAKAETEAVRAAKVDAERHAAALAEKDALYAKWQTYSKAAARVEELKAAADKAMLERSGRINLKAQEKTRLEENAALLGTVGCPVEYADTCRFLEAAVKARDALPALVAEIYSLYLQDKEATQAEIAAVQEAVAAMEAVGYDPARTTDVDRIIAETEGATRKYARLPEMERAMQTAEETLSKTGQQLHAAEAQLAELRGRLETAQAEAAGYDPARIEYVGASIREYQHFVEMDKRLPAARQGKVQAVARLTEISAELAQVAEEAQECRAEFDRENTAEDWAAVQYALTQAEQAVASTAASLRSIDQKIGSIDAQLESRAEAMKRIQAHQEQANEGAKRAAIYETLKAAFSQDGIPHNIIRTIIPVLEATATNILGQMSGGRMSVEFVTEKTLKSNSKKEVTTLDIIINDTSTGPLPYMSRSGGERVKAALSVILALAEVKSSEAGVQLGFLFIDEPPFLDADGVQAYCDALETIQRRYGDLKIMAITHDPAMKSRFPQSVDVEKTAEGSKVIYS